MSRYAINLLLGRSYPKGGKTVIIGNLSGIDYRTMAATTSSLKTDIGYDAYVTLLSPQNKAVASFFPVENFKNIVPNMLVSTITELRNSIKKSYEDVVAVLTGGVSYDSRDARSIESANLVDILHNILRKEGLETTTVACQYLDGTAVPKINSYAVGRNVTLWGKPINNLGLNKNSSDTEIINALYDRYEFVDVSPLVPVQTIDNLPASTMRFVKK